MSSNVSPVILALVDYKNGRGINDQTLRALFQFGFLAHQNDGHPYITLAGEEALRDNGFLRTEGSSAMTDNELRGRLLQDLYERRREDWVQIGLNQMNDPDAQERIRIARQLDEHGLITLKILNRHLGGMAKITAKGIDVLEGVAKSPISISIGSNQTYNISNSSNVQVGNNNSQTINNGLQALIKSIEESAGTQEQKEQAKSLLKKVLEHPLVSAVVGGAVGLVG